MNEADFCAALLTGAFAAFAGADFLGALFTAVFLTAAFLAATGSGFVTAAFLRCPTRSRYGTGELSDARAGSAPSRASAAMGLSVDLVSAVRHCPSRAWTVYFRRGF